MTGPLTGFKVVEFAGMGPGPFCAMMLSDMGADVIRIDRPGGVVLPGVLDDQRDDITNRGRRSIALNLKQPDAIGIALKLIERADALIEGYRPGVMEKFGLGPDVCLVRNPRLVYGRMTGWGQTGPLATAAGHDMNYVALSGALHAMGDPSVPPTPPLNLVADNGGGGMFLAFGIVSALLERATSGKGQVIDAAMTDGAAMLMAMAYGMRAAGKWNDVRGSNFLDGAAPFYGCYECADGKYVAIGPIEEKFYNALLDKVGVTPSGAQLDVAAWPKLKADLTRSFKTKTRDEWCKLMEGGDFCLTPVLDLGEAPQHPHNGARKTFVSPEGKTQPAPAPRFSRTAGAIRRPPPSPGEHSAEILRELGIGESDCVELLKKSAVAA